MEDVRVLRQPSMLKGFQTTRRKLGNAKNI
jgi:hypothetical protein